MLMEQFQLISGDVMVLYVHLYLELTIQIRSDYKREFIVL